MKGNKLFWLVLIIVIAILALTGTAFVLLNRQSGDVDNEIPYQLNESSNVNFVEDEGYTHIEGVYMLEGVEISNVRFKLIDKRRTRITGDVKNVSDNFVEPINARIKFITDDDVKSVGGIIPMLDIDEKKEFVTFALSDLSDTQKIEFEKISTENQIMFNE